MKISNAAPSCGALAVMYPARLGTTKAARIQNALFCHGSASMRESLSEVDNGTGTRKWHHEEAEARLS